MVTFRPAEMSDVDALYRFRMDDEVMYWASGGSGDAVQSRGQIEEQAHRISRRATLGMMIGDRQYWGKGYGTAVIKLFVRFLFTRYNLHRIDLATFSENQRAIRSYEKCGFVAEGVRRKAMWTVNGYRDQVMMGLLREDWDAQQ
jgi:RimJ/RimL family protein N-acetyltransferase